MNQKESLSDLTVELFARRITHILVTIFMLFFLSYVDLNISPAQLWETSGTFIIMWAVISAALGLADCRKLAKRILN